MFETLRWVNLSMTVSELLRLIPAQTFRDLAVETKVDTQVKKLSGEVMFKLMLFSMLSSDKLSLRVMETFLQSAKFKSFAHFDILESRYNSIRDRICTINAGYFEKLFETIFAIYNKELKEENALLADAVKEMAFAHDIIKNNPGRNTSINCPVLGQIINKKGVRKSHDTLYSKKISLNF